MNTIYKVNETEVTKSLAEFFFGKEFVEAATKAAAPSRPGNRAAFRIWQDGAGYLTIINF